MRYSSRGGKTPVTVGIPSEKSTALSWKLPFFRRSADSFATSMQATARLPVRENRSLSAKIDPFSATVQAPEKTKSVVDSPTPAEAYTYPQIHRPL